MVGSTNVMINGSKLRELLISRNKNQAEISIEYGYCPSIASNWIYRRKMSHDAFRFIVKKLELSHEELSELLDPIPELMEMGYR